MKLRLSGLSPSAMLIARRQCASAWGAFILPHCASVVGVSERMRVT